MSKLKMQMFDCDFSKVSDDLVLNIFSKLEDDPRHWARLACVSTRFSSLIHNVCCKRKCSQTIPSVVSDLLSPAPSAAPPGGWASMYKLSVCCPGLVLSGVLLENSDFGLERELGPEEQFRPQINTNILHSGPVQILASSGRVENMGSSSRAEHSAYSGKADHLGSSSRAKHSSSSGRVENMGSSSRAEHLGSSSRATHSSSSGRVNNLPSSDRVENWGSSGRAERLGSSGLVDNLGSLGQAESLGTSRRVENVGSSGPAACVGSSSRVGSIGSSSLAEKLGYSGRAENLDSSSNDVCNESNVNAPDCCWSLYDDLLFDTMYDESESPENPIPLPEAVNGNSTVVVKADSEISACKKKKICKCLKSHLASGVWNLSREQGNKLLASRFKGDCLYICDWPGCIHMEEKRNYMLFRGIFKNFKQSRVWRTINDGKRKMIDLNCAYCGAKQTWDLHSAFCLRSHFGFHDDGEPVVRAYVCENGHVSGAWTDWPLYT